MQNEQFLESVGITDKAAQQRCLVAMEKYGDNHWWELDGDPRKFAYHQLHEPIFLRNDVSMSNFIEDISLLLGRPISILDFVDRDALRAEATRAWTYQVGCTSDTERNERTLESVHNYLDWVEKEGK